MKSTVLVLPSTKESAYFTLFSSLQGSLASPSSAVNYGPSISVSALWILEDFADSKSISEHLPDASSPEK